MARVPVTNSALLELAGYLKAEFNFNNRSAIQNLDAARWKVTSKFFKTENGQVMRDSDGNPILREGKTMEQFTEAVQVLLKQWVEIDV